MLSVVWEGTRMGDLARAERMVASITDPNWRHVGLRALEGQRTAPAAVRAAPSVTVPVDGGLLVTSPPRLFRSTSA
jgi:hypothetical protein